MITSLRLQRPAVCLGGDGNDRRLRNRLGTLRALGFVGIGEDALDGYRVRERRDPIVQVAGIREPTVRVDHGLFGEREPEADPSGAVDAVSPDQRHREGRRVRRVRYTRSVLLTGSSR